MRVRAESPLPDLSVSQAEPVWHWVRPEFRRVQGPRPLAMPAAESQSSARWPVDQPESALAHRAMLVLVV